MEDHQHPMAASVASHERNLQTLFTAIDGDDDSLPTVDLLAIGVDPDDREESARQAVANYALEASTSTILTVTLGIGGPTQRLSAKVERTEYGSWERTGRVTFTDSWAVPSETELADDSPLVTFFDSEHVELMGE